MKLRADYSLGSFHIRINWLVAAAVIMTIATFARLGIWQLDRAADKLEAQLALELEMRDNAPAIESIPQGHLHRANPEIHNRHVSLTGEYLNERTILLLAEFFEGQIGYGVVTPFRLAATGNLVLVHRGWTSGILPPDTPPYLGTVEGSLSIQAQIHVPPANARIIASEVDASQWPLRIRSLELDIIEGILNEPLFPFEVRLTPEQPGSLVRHWPAANPQVDQNLSYALQWFSFAIIVLFSALFASSNLWSLIQQ